MNYKETLFFIGKCLTINHEQHNKILVEEQLITENVDWESIVKVSTSHYVFPALYCNLKRANFLHYLPEDLVTYMKHITDLNRERNQQIIIQAKEINELLLKNNITPIFLKGTGNLLEDLYEDVGERMVGDIDFIVYEPNCEKAYYLLKERGYNKVTDIYEEHRHLNRLIHSKKISAVEIHKSMLKEKKSNYFNYDSIKDSLFKRKNINLISIENQIKLTIFSKFINDDAYQLKQVGLRPCYDIFNLFNNRENQSKLIVTNQLQKELNAGLITYAKVLNNPKNMPIPNDKESIKFLNKTLKKINNNKKNKVNSSYYLFVNRFQILSKAFYKKTYFKFILKKAGDREWYKRRFGI